MAYRSCNAGTTISAARGNIRQSRDTGMTFSKLNQTVRVRPQRAQQSDVRAAANEDAVPPCRGCRTSLRPSVNSSSLVATLLASWWTCVAAATSTAAPLVVDMPAGTDSTRDPCHAAGRCRDTSRRRSTNARALCAAAACLDQNDDELHQQLVCLKVEARATSSVGRRAPVS